MIDPQLWSCSCADCSCIGYVYGERPRSCAACRLGSHNPERGDDPAVVAFFDDLRGWETPELAEAFGR